MDRQDGTGRDRERERERGRVLVVEEARKPEENH
jgi:hypothetical protein